MNNNIKLEGLSDILSKYVDGSDLAEAMDSFLIRLKELKTKVESNNTSDINVLSFIGETHPRVLVDFLCNDFILERTGYQDYTDLCMAIAHVRLCHELMLSGHTMLGRGYGFDGIGQVAQQLIMLCFIYIDKLERESIGIKDVSDKPFSRKTESGIILP